MKVEEVLSTARETMTVRQVFGEPYQQNGVTIIPAAAVRGGGGAGEGDAGPETPGGAGGGFGLSARPVGAYQIRGDSIEWVHAADVTRVIVISEIVAIVALLVMRSMFKSRRKNA